MTTETFITETASLEDKLIAYRRDFHRYAETGFLEFRTASLIARRLTELGCEVLVGRDVCLDEARMGVPEADVLADAYTRALEEGGDAEFLPAMEGGFTGVIGIIRGAKPGPVYGMRFDIDALGVMESEEDSHIPAHLGFASIHPGSMHACGHDGHATIGLGTAEMLTAHRDEIAGTVKLIFQPAEEGVRGANSIVAAGHLDDVEILIGSHITGLAEGEDYDITPGAGGSLATTKLDVYYTGQAAHAGGTPEAGVNAMLAMAAAVMNLQAIPRHSGGATRINVGRVIAGTGRNVIPDRAKLEIEIRGANTELNTYMEDYARRILLAAADMHGCGVEIQVMGGAPSLESDVPLMQKIQDLAPLWGLKPSKHLRMVSGGSEDFGFMMNRVQERGGQASFVRVMCPTAGPAHSPTFDFEESALLRGVRTFAGAVLLGEGLTL